LKDAARNYSEHTKAGAGLSRILVVFAGSVEKFSSAKYGAVRKRGKNNIILILNKMILQNPCAVCGPQVVSGQWSELILA